MTILRERMVTGRPRKQRQSGKRSFALSPEEHVNARAALRELHKHMSRKQIAATAQCSIKAIEAACAVPGRLSAGLAIRIARMANVPIEDVLSGAFPKAGHCPRCGWDPRRGP